MSACTWCDKEKPTEIPLHMRCAEALGVISNLHVGSHGNLHWNGTTGIPVYDTDWRATGPLIEQYRIRLKPYGPGWSANHGEGFGELFASGSTPLVAVCNLLLLLHNHGAIL